MKGNRDAVFGIIKELSSILTVLNVTLYFHAKRNDQILLSIPS